MTVTPFTTSANPQQHQAITTTEGPLLIIAGPGSGKTFTLVERLVYLIIHKAVVPESLFVATFTDKAAQELTTRISDRLNTLNVTFNLNEMYLGTIHSICLRLLDEHREFTRLKRNFMMMDSFDQLYFLYQRFSDYEAIAGLAHVVGDSEQTSTWHKVEQLQKWLNMASEEALEIARLLAAPEPEVRALGECYALYQRQLAEENALDFSTIQYEALKLLRTQPTVLAALQQKISYFMVDEYQDTNTVQEQILRLLAAGDAPNLCVVGDDDQGLYRFRGATIRNILEFPRQFPPGQCQQVELVTNYRSCLNILQWENVTDWRELAESVMLDWNYDGGVFEPKTVDIPAKDDLVTGRYAIPRTAGTIRVKITDLLSESWEGEVQFG